MIKWKSERTNLQRLIDSGIGCKDIAEKYGITPRYLRKVLKRLSVPLKDKGRTNTRKTKEIPLERLEMPSTAICLNCGTSIIDKVSANRKFCSNICQSQYKEREYIERWKRGEESGSISHGYAVSRYIRNYLMEKYNNSCQMCGWGEINPFTSKVPLQIHHVDGDSLNCKESNLMLLCPNCHSLTDNFGSRNKSATRGRTEYFKKK